MADTKIEWADRVWNPVTGCSKVSPGCKNCYAARMATRLRGRLGYPLDNPFAVTLRPERLQIPTNWRKGSRIFVNSMSDLFHPEVPFEFILRIFSVMATTPRHNFLVLTKRPERILEWQAWYEAEGWALGVPIGGLPLPNVWLGVSAENQATADKRIPLLLQAKAALRFVSAEPLLGPLDLREYLRPSWGPVKDNGLRSFIPALDWLIAGGESGPGARPAHPAWFRSLRDQCHLGPEAPGGPTNTAFFFKQTGEWALVGIKGKLFGYEFETRRDRYLNLAGEASFEGEEVVCVRKVGTANSGRLLDGIEWNQIPEVE